MMTLNELKKRVPVADKNVSVLGKTELLKTGAEVVVKEIIEKDVVISVYDNGFVLYEEGRHRTIFRLHECSGYDYCSMDGKTEVFGSEFFENENWYILLMMIGMDRVETNRKRLLSNHKVLSFDMEENDYLSLKSLAVSDMVEDILRKETMVEIADMLNERQLYAVTAYYCDGIPQAEIAEKLHISQQAASGLIKRSLGVIRNHMQISSSDIRRKRNKK